VCAEKKIGTLLVTVRSPVSCPWIYCSLFVWQKRRTGDGEVAGSSLTHCAVEYGPGKDAQEQLPLSPSSIVWYYSDAPKLGR